MTVHYQWHPLAGERFKCRGLLRSVYGERLAVVELSGNLPLGIPEWMTDPAACADLRLGDRCVSMHALLELDALLGSLRSIKPTSEMAAETAEEPDAGEKIESEVTAEAAVHPTEHAPAERSADSARGCVG